MKLYGLWLGAFLLLPARYFGHALLFAIVDVGVFSRLVFDGLGIPRKPHKTILFALAMLLSRVVVAFALTPLFFLVWGHGVGPLALLPPMGFALTAAQALVAKLLDPRLATTGLAVRLGWLSLIPTLGFCLFLLFAVSGEAPRFVTELLGKLLVAAWLGSYFVAIDLQERRQKRRHP
jgi:hypothetical protein